MRRHLRQVTHVALLDEDNSVYGFPTPSGSAASTCAALRAGTPSVDPHCGAADIGSIRAARVAEFARNQDRVQAMAPACDILLDDSADRVCESISTLGGQTMRMLMHVQLPLEPFNSAVRDGTAGKKMQRILEAIKP
jgi:hypothetical protein